MLQFDLHKYRQKYRHRLNPVPIFLSAKQIVQQKKLPIIEGQGGLPQSRAGVFCDGKWQ